MTLSNPAHGGARYQDAVSFFKFFGEMAIVIVMVQTLGQCHDLLLYMLGCASVRPFPAVSVSQDSRPLLSIGGDKSASMTQG
jgi:hypothetical protein